MDRIIMDRINHPTKEQVRLYMELRQVERNMPPPIEEIRRRLGWNLVAIRATGACRNMAH